MTKGKKLKMNKNLMGDLVKLLGVEMNEKFVLLDLKGNECGVYNITKEGLRRAGDDFHAYNDTFIAILEGYYSIKKLPWTPRVGQIYYYPVLEACRAVWEGNKTDTELYASDLVYKTTSEAIRGGLKLLKTSKRIGSILVRKE